MGEQLSHFAQFGNFSEHYQYLTMYYCELKNVKFEELQIVFDVSPFFRAVSGIRDSVSPLLYKNNDRSKDKHLERRINVLATSIETAVIHVSRAFEVLGVSERVMSRANQDLRRLSDMLERK